MADRGAFDAAGFFSALDKVREDRQLNWKRVASEAHVSQSTLTRLAQGRRPDVDSLAALLDWAGLSADQFVLRVHGDQQHAEPITMISTYLRADKNLSPDQAKALDAVIRTTYKALRTN